MLSGNVEQGLLYLEQAAALDPTNELMRLQLARAYLAAGRDSEASSLLRSSSGEVAHAVEAKLLRLFAEDRQGDAGSTAEIAEELVADFPDDPRVLTAVAVHYQINGDTGRARDLFERAAEFDTEDVTARLFVAASLVQEGREDEAEQLLRQTVLQQPKNAQALAGLARLLASRGVVDEAVELFGRAAEHTTSAAPRLALVRMRLRQGNIAEASRELDRAEAVAPDNAELIALRGIVALAERRFDDAVTLLERARSLLPDHLGVALTLARARLANGQAATARDELSRILELAPGSFPIRLALGDAELQAGNAEAALSLATDLKVEFPSQAGGYLLEGKALITTRQYSAASNSLARAFERQPTWPILALKVQALRLADRPAEAFDVIEAYLIDNPGHGPAGLLRADLLQTAGRDREALDAYKAVLKVEPENLVALNNAAWYGYELGDPDALSFAERAFEVGPENASVLDTFGWILLAEGKNELAVENLSRAAELAPQAPAIRYHLAKALVAHGQSARAREILEALLTEKSDFGDRADAERLLESMQAEVILDQ
jgi:putative PEP-CTERM system TPR-repeat lipoprotein